MEKKKKVHYVDTKKMYDDLVAYRKACVEAEDAGDEEPRIPDSLGRAFISIADGIARRDNFRGYSYIDEMKEDGIENCITAVKSFDPEKGSNPFGYFSRIIWFAFLRRIKTEKKQTYIKYMSLVNASMDGSIIEGVDDNGMFANIPIDDSKMRPIIEMFAKKSKDDEDSTDN